MLEKIDLLKLLEKFFYPKSVALVGASNNPEKFGYTIMKNLQKADIKIYPISRSDNEVLGIKAYKSVLEIKEDIDLAIIIIPAKYIPSLFEDLAKKNVKHAVVLSGGFSEVGKEGEELEEKLKDIAHKYGIRFIGPNCVGVINKTINFNGTFIMDPDKGDISFISQSGALGAASVYWLKERGIGLSKFASIGNSTDIGFSELLKIISEDKHTKVIALYIEGVKDGREFMEAAKYASERKPLVILKAGKSVEGAKAVSSHTGSLAGSHKIFEAVIKQVGAIEVDNLYDLFNVSLGFAFQNLPKGNKVAIITNAGGAGVLTTDELSKYGLTLANFTEKSRKKLDEVLIPIASKSNPIDVIASGNKKDYYNATKVALEDENVNAVIVCCVVPTFMGMTRTEHAEGVYEAIKDTKSEKPVIAVWMSGEIAKPGTEYLEAYNIPTYNDPQTAAKVLGLMYQYAKNK